MTRAEKERQRRQAVKRATEIRMAKAQLKRELGARPAYEGLAQVADIIEERGKFDVATPHELIRACRNVGRLRANEITAKANIDPDVRLRDIAPERRKAIAFDVRRLAAHRKRRNGFPEESDEIGPDD